MKKKILLVVAGVVLILLVGMGIVFWQTARAADSLQIGKIELTELPDGSYEGEAKAGIVQARVQVQIQDHRIAKIVLLKHLNGMGGEAESVLHAAKQSQSLQVDTISGATISSKVLLKACENALSLSSAN